ncbi:M48 family metallopeptidase [Thalassovita taeanensis]|uniref:Peptidase family M48 n=1 Tax=Thalassovita taeanensis TaxID=657014 RepID=A0A1H9BDP8_9RHOB|nr:M48 family metallopeptidase [Thalassovita taeanensis]SEP86398.1 Peptidase family M48 [Thalassovita taeanensis]
MRWIVLSVMLVLAGCAAPMPQSAVQPAGRSVVASPEELARQFVQVVDTVEPVAERECRQRAPAANCDFRILVDAREGQPANAYQSLDEGGRPVIVFTLALISEVENADELAFVMGHETAHHISGHIARQRQNAAAGAEIFAGLATLTGANASGVRSAQELGAAVGARSYSKEFELEADALGTIITKRAGYDPVRGAAYFSRIPDPGNRFLGTHPPNARRIDVVRRTAASL